MTATFICEGIGTKWWFELLDRSQFSDELAQKIVKTITTYDQEYSRFKPDSYIGRLNKEKFLPSPPEELVNMFHFAQEMFVISHGAFNISVGGELHSLGYGSRSLAAKIDPFFWDKTEVSDEYIRIPETAVIDNGGFGKGWLIDKLGDLLRSDGYEHWIVNGGGDVLVSSATPMTIGLEHPDGETLVGTTRISHGGLGVSSNNKRTWVHEGKRYHHIIDPAGEQPTVQGSYVKADTALLADTLATIVFLRPDLVPTLERDYNAQVLLHPVS